MLKAVIFDFDGTIADSLPMAITIFNKLAPVYGFRSVEKEDIETLRGQSVQALFKILKIPVLKIPFLVAHAQNEMHKRISTLSAIPGIKGCLHKLKKEEYRLGILTSNSRNNVHKFLENNNLDMFDFVYSGSSLFGKDKVISGLLRERKLKPDEIIYIGDEIRDIEAARKTRVKIISVSWGFNSEKGLEKYKPDYLIAKPDQLIQTIKKI